MGLRDTLNEKPGVTTAITATIVVLAMAYIVYNLLPRSRPPVVGPTSAFFTDDAGATYAPRSSSALYEVDANGEPTAVRVHVFRWPDTKEVFVGFMERVTKERAAEVRRIADGSDPVSLLMADLDPTGHLVAKPGKAQWFELASRQGAAVSDTPSRDGKYAVEVFPE